MQIDSAQAVEILYIRHAKRLERLCFQYVGYASEYQDLIDSSLQATFLQAWRDWDRLKEHPCIEGWLTKTCMNRLRASVAKYRRRKKHHVALTEETLAVMPDQLVDIAERFAEQQETTEIFARVLAALNHREQRIIYQHFVQDLSLEQIAEEENTSIPAVKSVLARLRGKARDAKKIGYKLCNFRIFFARNVLKKVKGGKKWIAPWHIPKYV